MVREEATHKNSRHNRGGNINVAGNSKFTLIDGRIKDGMAVHSASQYGGGGLFNNGGTVLLINSLIDGNEIATDNTLGVGGAVSRSLCNFLSFALLSFPLLCFPYPPPPPNTHPPSPSFLSKRRPPYVFPPQGISTSAGGSTTIIGCTIENNKVRGTASFDHGGGGVEIYGSGSTTIIRDSIIRTNSVHLSMHGGAGLRASSSGTSVIVSNTVFDGNTAAVHSTQKGAAVFIKSGSTGSFSNVTFRNNVAATGGGAYVEGELL